MGSPVRRSRERTTRRRIIILSVGMTVVMGALVAVLAVRLTKGPSLSQAESALRRGNSAEALRIAEATLRKHPGSIEALMIGGRAASSQKKYEVALGYFHQAANAGGGTSIAALNRCGQVAIQLGRLADGEQYFRRAVAIDPENLEAREGLVSLLRLEGRTWEVLPHVHQLLRHRRYVVAHLEVAGTLEASWVNQNHDLPFLNYCFRVQPDDPMPMLGVIRLLIARQFDIAVAREGLTAIVESHPDLNEAQAMLGQLVLETGTHEDFVAWHSQLPREADRHPSVWVVRGRWVHSQGDTRGAIRCLLEALQRCPNDRAASLLVANLLTAIGSEEQARLFQQRGDDLLAFDDALLRGETKDGKRTPARLMTMIAALERLGRLWEAAGWSHHLLEVDPGSQFAADTISRLTRQLTPDTPLTLAAANPANFMELADFPLPTWPSSVAPASSDAPTRLDSAIAFDDVSGQIGLDFRYFLDGERLERELYTFDFAGGGVGVLDFDLDGWPDLYLSQSCRWPPGRGDQSHRNALFQNDAGQSFTEVIALAGSDDDGFGQGVAVGDFDNDGFPDLYLCNVGPNRLFLNNGDGTFRGLIGQSGTAGNEFSLSAVVADLNGDGWPDLYVVNYLGGDALTRQCEERGKPVQCAPTLFPGQQDRLYLNLGDGRFREVTDEAGILDPLATGKGMGVLAADLDGQGGLDLLVTNDTTANFLYMNATEPTTHVLKLVEQGRTAGVAYDDRGRLQGSMGIAAMDVSQDGMLDVFVTNFFAEPNNLFFQVAQQPSALFNDGALEANLLQPSIPRVGWGAQFLDAELDGDWDLFVANGHLDDTAAEAEGGMLPQFFENVGTAQFREAGGNSLGRYFHSKHFGRAVASLDWNRDGRNDLCVTHRGDPASLLENTSARRGHFVAIQLRGTVSSRDAIGSFIRIAANGREWTVQLTAGDGFEASNQRQLVVGLGECNRVDQITVRWPTGNEQIFRDLDTDREWILVEGRESPCALP